MPGDDIKLRLQQEFNAVDTDDVGALAQAEREDASSLPEPEWFLDAEKRDGAERAEAGRLCATWRNRDGSSEVLDEDGTEIVLKTCGATRRHLRILLLDAEYADAVARISLAKAERDVVIYTRSRSRLGRAYGHSDGDMTDVRIPSPAFAMDIAQSADVAIESGAWLWNATCDAMVGGFSFTALFHGLDIDATGEGEIDIRLSRKQQLASIKLPME